MIPLAASGEGNLIVLIIFAVIGVINWLVEKSKKKAEDGEGRPVVAPRQPDADGGGSEQERLRRFMEALGVPQPPQQPPQRPGPQRQVQRREAAPAQPRRAPIQQARPAKAAAQPKPKPRPQLIPEPEEFATAGRLEEAARAIEQVSNEFGVMNVHVDMPPPQKMETPSRLATANAGTTRVAGHDGSALAALLRRSLSTPTNARLAVLTAEILGPPKALRT